METLIHFFPMYKGKFYETNGDGHRLNDTIKIENPKKESVTDRVYCSFHSSTKSSILSII